MSTSERVKIDRLLNSLWQNVCDYPENPTISEPCREAHDEISRLHREVGALTYALGRATLRAETDEVRVKELDKELECFELVPWERLVTAFGVSLDQIQKAISHLGYLYRRLAMHPDDAHAKNYPPK
jgi:hypothetical protein